MEPKAVIKTLNSLISDPDSKVDPKGLPKGAAKRKGPVVLTTKFPEQVLTTGEGSGITTSLPLLLLKKGAGKSFSLFNKDHYSVYVCLFGLSSVGMCDTGGEAVRV